MLCIMYSKLYYILYVVCYLKNIYIYYILHLIYCILYIRNSMLYIIRKYILYIIYHIQYVRQYILHSRYDIYNISYIILVLYSIY
jgi:hypothetical protein